MGAHLSIARMLKCSVIMDLTWMQIVILTLQDCLYSPPPSSPGTDWGFLVNTGPYDYAALSSICVGGPEHSSQCKDVRVILFPLKTYVSFFLRPLLFSHDPDFPKSISYKVGQIFM